MSATANIWIMAGEASGDLYGAALATALREQGRARGVELTVGGMGGAQMRAAGCRLTVDSTELGVIGVIEVLKHLPAFIGIFFRLVAAVRRERPLAVVLIDYPTFNMLFARVLRYTTGIPAIWYVSPHVWVWGKGRIKKLARLCRKMLVIFPFETEIYRPSHMPTEFVGHPLVDMVEARRDPSIRRDPQLVALLPGSRGMEIDRLFTPMLATAAALAARHSELKFVIAAPRERVAARCREQIAAFRRRHAEVVLPELPIRVGETAIALQAAGTGLAASGTITVESAIAGLPLVVVYKLKRIENFFFTRFVRLFRNAITMPNIIANKTVFEEFMQERVCPAVLVPALERILPGGPERVRVEADMREVTTLLRPEPGVSAAARAARSVLESVKISPNQQGEGN